MSHFVKDGGKEQKKRPHVQPFPEMSPAKSSPM